jgi:alpha-amylase
MNKLVPAILLCLFACNTPVENKEVNVVPQIANGSSITSFVWENASIYFLLIDRFYNGDSTNDQSFGRKPDGGPARYFMGGDLKGITAKIREGYFQSLGIDAIWITPPVEQIHGSTDEGTGLSYGYHGYWARDWTAIDPNFGTMDDLAELVREAHDKEIRIIMDVVLNHTGPVTEIDSQWPDEWVRTGPPCTYVNAETTIECTLVKNLPDIITEKESPVELPPFLVKKWKEEGRYEEEILELDAFFARTGYARAPKYYLIKWLTDYIRDFGIDGFRVDTAKHVEEEVWEILKKEAMIAFEEWKKSNPAAAMDDTKFYMMGEVYNYVINHGQEFPMGENQYVNFYENGFNSLINFDFKRDANKNLDSVYSAYSKVLNDGELNNYSIVNYISSHDDGDPFDRQRELAFEAGTRLILAPGAAQIYYGDELARPLMVPDAQGDAHLRSFMNWEDLEDSQVYKHWSLLGNFRKAHPSIGAGVHKTLSSSPFVFTRTYDQGHIQDKVLVALNTEGPVNVSEEYQDGTQLYDAYSDTTYTVTNGEILISEKARVLLLAEKEE